MVAGWMVRGPMKRFRVRRPTRGQDGTEQTAPPVSVSESGDAVATDGGDALSGYRGPGPQMDGGAVRVERSGDAIAAASHAVAISGNVSQVLVSAPPPRQPLHWPVRLGSVPVLASAFQDRSSVRDRIDQARAGHTTVVLAQVLSGGGGVGKTQLAAAYECRRSRISPCGTPRNWPWGRRSRRRRGHGEDGARRRPHGARVPGPPDNPPVVRAGQDCPGWPQASAERRNAE